MAREQLSAALRDASTADLAWALGEILEPSRDGPLGKGYREDADFEAFMDATWPVMREYQKAYPELCAAVERQAVAA